jgi:hypothetical protein
VFRAPGRTLTEAHSSAIQAISGDNHPRHYNAARIFVGFGAGKTVLALDVTLIDLRADSHPTILSFDSRSITGSMPGGVSAGSAVKDVSAAKSIHTSVQQGLPRETQQTIAKIDDQLSTYFLSQKWPYIPAPTAT